MSDLSEKFRVMYRELVRRRTQLEEHIILTLGGPEALGGPVAALHYHVDPIRTVFVDKDGEALAEVRVFSVDTQIRIEGRIFQRPDKETP